MSTLRCGSMESSPFMHRSDLAFRRWRKRTFRAAAARALESGVTRAALLPLVRSCNDEFRRVRIRAAATLAGVPPGLIPPADQGSVERATGEYLASLRVRPDDPGSHLNRGNLHMERGAVRDAIEAFDVASRLDPEALAPHVNAAVAHAAAGDRGAAEVPLRKALAIDPDHAPAKFNLGLLLADILLELGRRDEAASVYRDGLSSPGLPPAAQQEFERQLETLTRFPAPR